MNNNRVVDLESLKALAHPLRVRLIDTLSTYGPATATGLADRLGESSGATSYHLRQLAKHGFVREVEGRGTGRERWWERTPGGLTMTTPELMESPAGREASHLVMREWAGRRENVLRDFMEHGTETLSKEWLEASLLSQANFVLTAPQLDDLTGALMAVVDEYKAKYSGQSVVGARPVQIHVNGFPVLDGTEIGTSDAGEGS